MRKTLCALVLFLVTVMAAQNVAYQQDPSWRPPDDAVQRANPLASRPELAAGGRKLFRRHCAECHGDDGRGLKRAADLQLPMVQEQADGALFWKVTNGNPRRGMPSFSALPEAQRWQLVLYLRELAPEQQTKCEGAPKQD